MLPVGLKKQTDFTFSGVDYVIRLHFQKNVTDWQAILAESVINAKNLPDYLGIDSEGIDSISDIYPMLVNPYYLSLIRSGGNFASIQAIPDPREL